MDSATIFNSQVVIGVSFALDIDKIIQEICDADNTAPWTQSAPRNKYAMELWDLLSSDIVAKGQEIIDYYIQDISKPNLWIVKHLIGFHKPEGLDEDDVWYQLERASRPKYQLTCLDNDVLQFVISFCDQIDKARLNGSANMFTDQFPIPTRPEYLFAYTSPDVTLPWVVELLGVTETVRRLIFDACVSTDNDLQILIKKFTDFTDKSSITHSKTSQQKPQLNVWTDLKGETVNNEIEYLHRIGIISRYLTGGDIINLAQTCKFLYNSMLSKDWLQLKNKFTKLCINKFTLTKYDESESDTFVWECLKHLNVNVKANETYPKFKLLIKKLNIHNLVVYEGTQMINYEWGPKLQVIKQVGPDIGEGLQILPPVKIFWRDNDLNYELQYFKQFDEIKCKILIWTHCILHGKSLADAMQNEHIKCIVIQGGGITGPYNRVFQKNKGAYKTMILNSGYIDWWKFFQLFHFDEFFSETIDHLYIKSNLAGVNDYFVHFLNTLLNTGGVRRWIKILFEVDGEKYGDNLSSTLFTDKAQNLSEQVIFRWIWNNLEAITNDPSFQEFKFGILNTCVPHKSFVIDITQIVDLMQVWTAHKQWLNVIYTGGQSNDDNSWMSEWDACTARIHRLCE